jgi:SAM-dependent methyltransferase
VDEPQTTARRRSFDRHADTYRGARPAYPAAVYDLLATTCGLASGCRVLEIGAGTGQATRDLLARGASVVALEPGAALAAHLVTDLPGPALYVVHSDLEAVELPDACVDLAVAATSFHWLRPEVALPLLARVLRPHGWLAVWWTVFGDPERRTTFRQALDRVYARRLPHERRGPTTVPGPLRTGSWTAELERGGWFEVVRVELLRWEHQLTPDAARALFGSFPNVNELAAAERADFLDAVAGLVDRSGGVVADPYVTAVYLARRRFGGARSGPGQSAVTRPVPPAVWPLPPGSGARGG